MFSWWPRVLNDFSRTKSIYKWNEKEPLPHTNFRMFILILRTYLYTSFAHKIDFAFFSYARLMFRFLGKQYNWKVREKKKSKINRMIWWIDIWRPHALQTFSLINDFFFHLIFHPKTVIIEWNEHTYFDGKNSKYFYLATRNSILTFFDALEIGLMNRNGQVNLKKHEKKNFQEFEKIGYFSEMLFLFLHRNAYWIF